MRLAIIPARGGSKRIPRKNIKDFCGKPMIAWSIEAALKSGCFDKIVVSTDDIEIADIAREYGADVPFLRPKSLADDHTGTLPVIRQAIEACQERGIPARQVCCIYATAPFIRPEDLSEGLSLLDRSGAAYAFSVTTFAFPILRAIRLREDGRVGMFWPEYLTTRSQDLEEAYHDAGQFYWGQVEAWLREIPLFTEASVPVLLPRHRVQDIDTPEDWIRAEWLFKAMCTEATSSS
ncbi:pseudaminic acid cytidylyltransferase [Pseudomonas aeruginosa]|uniref:pseudaminic acid cytidylyltransferase n=1 Tax=Pseudomonas aeruginosa TaxID=287 RepID=UPI00053E6453|nr:pseudaminic acid cytidylyltransferase [Pseudomonas aeruginosa]EKV3032780.1 pseudaminic acid cytidylyltransferase [Pseudomonas aeruginosa]EKV3071956.1 pseudaminic acid cytidylyltransferase [Pseudomonas aeruginosa]EME5357382.1 pseudaminic acid cytidylyltransferase [Pseudomonas aeruginosa]MCO5624341.1 pseudaminic acid cytidylyltransferase [Pseudomonas aeruginosa]MCS8556453.1 pseudaminic acid cytidylyltransferase [Pseudomonas aeruginosa]